MPGPLILPPELNDDLRVLQLRAQWEYSPFGAGESAWNFVSFRVDLATQQQALWDLWEQYVKPAWVARRPEGWEFTRVLVVDKYPGVGMDLEIDLNETVPPNGLDGAPIQVSPVMTWFTDYPGRSYRGRTYWGQIARQDLYFASFTFDLFAALAIFQNAMIDTFATPGGPGLLFNFCVISKQHDLMPEPVGRYAQIRYGQLRTDLAIQRRRRYAV
jgi:hypothetical protein